MALFNFIFNKSGDGGTSQTSKESIINYNFNSRVERKTINDLNFKVWITYDSNDKNSHRLFQGIENHLKSNFKLAEIIANSASGELYAEANSPFLYNSLKNQNQLIPDEQQYIYSITIIDSLESHLVAATLSENDDLAKNSLIFIHNTKSSEASFFNKRTKLMLKYFKGELFEYKEFKEVYATLNSYLTKKLKFNLKEYKSTHRLYMDSWIFIYLYSFKKLTKNKLEQHCSDLPNSEEFNQTFEEMKDKKRIKRTAKGLKSYELSDEYIKQIKDINPDLYRTAEQASLLFKAIES